MQQNKLDFGAFIRDANGNYATARPATEAELIAQATALLETRLRGDPQHVKSPKVIYCSSLINSMVLPTSYIYSP